MSKTVKRVSKTVKRVMRVTMVGLVAMLGAKAEAHYIVVKNKVKYCSVCVDADFTQHDEGVNANIRHTEHAEFVATIFKGDANILWNGLCGIRPSSGDVTLRVRKPIVEGNITQATLTGGSVPDITTTKVAAVLSDAAFNRLIDNICLNQKIVDVLIHKISVDIKTYAVCGNPHTCPLDPLFDTLQVTCTLDPTFSLNSYPLKLPPPGTPYKCQ